MDTSLTNIFDLSNELIVIIISYCDYYTKLQIRLVHSKLNAIIKGLCKLTLHLKNIVLDDGKYPLTMIETFGQKYDKIIFENVGFGCSLNRILPKILESVRQITYTGQFNNFHFETLFALLLNCDPGNKCLDIITENVDMFNDTILTDVLPKFKSVSISNHGLGSMVYGRFFDQFGLSQRRRSFIFIGAPNAEKHSNLASSIHRKGSDIVSKFTKQFIHVSGLRNESLCGWKNFVEITKDLNFSSFFYVVPNHRYDGVHNIKELIKYHPNLRMLNIIYTQDSFDAISRQSYPTPTINTTFNHLTKIVIENASERFSLNWLWFNNFPVLTELHLLSNGFLHNASSHCLKSIFEALPNLLILNIKEQRSIIMWNIPILKYCRKLRHLALCVNPIQPEIFSLNSGETTNLIGLDISGCKPVSERLMQKICANIPRLQILNISRCENVTIRQVSAICNKLPELREIHMNYLSTDLVQYVMSKVQQLKHLQTIGAYPTKSAYMEFAEALPELVVHPRAQRELKKVQKITLNEILKFFRSGENVRALFFEKRIYKTEVMKNTVGSPTTDLCSSSPSNKRKNINLRRLAENQ